MDELLEKRIERALEGMTDEQARKVLDYIEFIQSKYGDRSRRPSAIERIADGVEDTLRVGKVPFTAIKGTRDVFNTADKFVKGVADVGRAVVDEIQTQLKSPDRKTSEEPAAHKPETGTETPQQSKPEPEADTDRSEDKPGTA